MTPPLRYASAKALHDAIKVRVAAVAEDGRYDINQLRRHFAYDRFLTRLFLDPNSTWCSRAGLDSSSGFRSMRATHKNRPSIDTSIETIDLAAFANKVNPRERPVATGATDT
jgi:hypothetical protein